jgi:hypothetical protein
MAQAVSRRPLIAEVRLRAMINPCGICGGEGATGQVSLRVLRFSPVIIIPPSSPNSYHLGDEQHIR